MKQFLKKSNKIWIIGFIIILCGEGVINLTRQYMSLSSKTLLLLNIVLPTAGIVILVVSLIYSNIDEENEDENEE